ncbi:MAG: GFA family protein [Alphaproteobacteria bacterium]|nr:GFA family protein [Alphaproteobacteria bacterium]
MLASDIREGACRCGAVRFKASGKPIWTAHCHCKECRAATGSPFTTYAGYAEKAVSYSPGAPLTAFESSPGVERRFCARCGTPIDFKGARWPGEIHLFISNFAEPGAFAPFAHAYCKDQLPWVKLNDGLPRYRTLKSEGGPLPP